MKQTIHTIIRTNHVGECCAVAIYSGQIKYIKHNLNKTQYNDYLILIQHMLDQEIHHFHYFIRQALINNVRTSRLLRICYILGYLLGIISCAIDIKMAMLVTEAIEDVVEKHYLKQLCKLSEYNTAVAKDLMEHITQFRLDEIEHRDTAIKYHSRKIICASILRCIIQTLCKLSIIISNYI